MPAALFLYPGNFPGVGGPGSPDQPSSKLQHFLQPFYTFTVRKPQCGKGMLTGTHVSVIQSLICDAA